MLKRLFTAKSSASKKRVARRYVQCRTRVKRGAVTRRTIDGVEHIIVSSRTLPDDIVMNGVLYPSDEVDASYQTLERSLAPIEHPQDSNGTYISATDAIAINNYYAGAYNINVRRDDDVIAVDKVINVQEAARTDRGKRLLDRINDIETNESAAPIHTSVGVYVDVTELDQPAVNARGQEYQSIASNLLFDHDAILLDSTGAATPDQGVGIAVNEMGVEFEVSRVSCDEENEELEVNTNEIETEGDKMRDMIVNALEKAGVKIEGLTDEQLFEQYSKLMSNNNTESDNEDTDKSKEPQEGDIEKVIVNALKPLNDEIDSLKQSLKSNSDGELQKLAEIVANSEKYTDIDIDAAKKMGVDTLKKLAANCTPSYGLPLRLATNGGKNAIPEMPE